MGSIGANTIDDGGEPLKNSFLIVSKRWVDVESQVTLHSAPKRHYCLVGRHLKGEHLNVRFASCLND